MKEENRPPDQVVGELAAMHQRIDELETLQRTGLQLSSSLDLSTVLDTIAQSALALVGASDCLIYLYDEASESFAFGTALGRWAGKDAVLTPRPSGLTATVVRRARPVVIDDAMRHPLYDSPQAQRWSIRAIAGFPLLWAGRVLGVLHVVFVEPHTFRENELRALGLLADQAAIAIENSQVYSQAQQEIAQRTQAEDELRQLKEFNEGIVQNMAEGIFVLDADGRFTFVNPASAALLGNEIDEFVGQHWTAVVPPDQYPVVEAADERRARGESDRYELQLIRKDGTRVPVQLSGSPRLDPNTGQLLGTMGVLTDLTERLRAEEELRHHRDHLEELVKERTSALEEANAQLHREIAERKQAEAERERLLAAVRAQARRQAALFRLSAELAATLGETEVCRRVVDGLRETLGYDFVALFLLDRASGDRILAASVGFDEPPTRLVPGQGLCERPLLDGQLQYTPDVTQDARYVYGLQGSEVDVPIRIAGKVSGVLVAENRQPDAFDEDDFEVLTAATQQTAIAIQNARLYADLRSSQEYARGIIDSSLDPIIAVDRERRVVEFNRAAHETFGYRREEILGQLVDLLYAKPGEGLDTHRTTIEQGQCVREVMNRRKNGEVFPAFLSASLLHDTQGQLVGVMGISRDVTERKRAEADLRRYHEHLEERVQERTAELRKSEERYRTLFDGVPVGLYRSTPAGELVNANLALVEMLGYPSREEYLAIDLANPYVDAQDRVRWQALMEQEGVVRDFETRLRRYDGTVIWANDTARAVKDERGQMLYYEGSLEDITERKQTAEQLRSYREHLEEEVEERTAELRKSEERYRTLFDGVPVGLYRTTPEGQFLDLNLAAVQLVGYQSLDELMAEASAADMYVDPRERARWQALMEKEGVVRDFEEQIRRTDGTVLWIKDTARAVKDEQGRVLYYEGSLEDITERKQFEEEIRRQKDYFQALFANSPVAVMTADLDANVVSWNPMAERLFGYTQQEAIGRHIDELVANDPVVREEALSYTQQLQTTGRIQATTKRTRKDGSLVDVEVLVLPVIVAGQEAGYIGIYYDIGELQQARREAEAANQAKSTFLANMSHELRTPLNAILGFSQLMDGDPNLTDEQQENLEIINRSGEHLLALINDVLEMSKIEAGRVTLQESRFDLHGLLDSLEEMFRLRAEDRGLTLSLHRAENVPRHVVTDEGKLRQVLSNLLGNAVKFTKEGAVMLRVSALLPALPCPSGRELLHFEVEDTGPGIAPEELAAVFEPFVQAASQRDLVPTEAREGTGLGLSISRQFVRLMGGDITASSELAQGSLFQFDVQVGLAAATEAKEPRPGRRVLGMAPDQRAADGRPFRLLVVEDEETNRRLLVKLLESLGFEVQEAADGQQALEVWERWQPHLIWMDMRMPVMDGHKATQQIKATPKGQAAVVIALTATAFEEDREQILLEGCDDFVRKPFRKDEIYDMLSKHLGVRFLYDEEPAPAPQAGPAQTAYVPSAKALAALPAGWLADLQQATTRADLHLILHLAGRIREYDAALADGLADLARNYEYKTILTLIEQAGG
jgi:PAS domain S-box-containing protein